MDPKASAKAKRSHTQHGRKSHPTPSATAQKKKATQAGSNENLRRPHSQTLPSNWDRYDDGEEEYERSDGVTMAEREIAPKSRGANFAYLIEQARSQQHRAKAPAAAESLSFFDELPLDFMQGVSSTFTARGKNLLSRCEDDNFVVDDDLSPSFEVPFLNLDLHALAAQLSKLKLSERLFIEADILSEDLRSEDSEGVSSSLQSETLGAINVTQDLDSLPYSSPAKDLIFQIEDENINVFPHSNLSQIHSDQGNEQGTGGDAQISPGNTQKISSLNVGEAEVELDLLLESFQETSLSNSIQDRPSHRTPPEISFPDSTRTNRTSNLADTGLMNINQTIEAELDSLLDPIHGNAVDRISDLKPRSSNFYQSSSMQDRVFSKNTVAASIDDSIDALLSETSPVPNIQKHVIPADRPPGADQPHQILGSGSIDGGVSVKGHFSDLGSGDVIGDFDSWIDTF